MTNDESRMTSGRSGKCVIRHSSFIILAIAIASLTACKPKPLTLDQAPKNPPTRQQLVAAHNDRVARLATTYSDGVIELRWTDDKGKHFEQGDLEFWQTTENRTALRVSKLGEHLLWLGSDKDRWWLFELINKDDRVLYLGRHDEPIERLGALGVKPLALLDLLGLTAIDAATVHEADKPPAFDKARGAWVIEAAGRGGAMRLFFDPATLLPKHIEELDAAGKIVAESDLSRYQTVELKGVAVMAQPKMASLIDIRRGADAEAAAEPGKPAFAGQVKIAMDHTVGYVDEGALRNIFNVERLKLSLQPDRIEQQAGRP